LSGLKLSGKRDPRWRTRFGAVFGRLSVGRPYVRKLSFMARRYGRCCMYEHNYVKLSRVFAVQLFSMFIGHYSALPPVRSDPHWPHSPQPCHHRLHSPRPHPYTAIPTARDSNLDSGNHDMSRLSTLTYLNDAPIHGLTDIPLRLLPTDIGCGTLDPRSRQDTATHAARDSNLGSGNHDMSRRSALAYPNDAPIHGLADIAV
jgi:hypothetical protein